MAGHSYICKIRDLGGLIKRMEKLSEGTNAVFHYDPQVVTGLKHSTWARIRWFYYCDQQGGNTIRLYDREFFDNSERLYEETQSCVILRGENLGKPSGEVKIAIRRELRDLKTPPLGINTRPENKEKCFQFFGRLNTLPEGADDE